MTKTTEVVVPDIGDYKDVPVIELLVSPGDRVDAEQSLITLESDKATMDVPAPESGIVREIKVAVGDAVSEGTAIVVLEIDDGDASGDGAQAKAAPDGDEDAEPGAQGATGSRERTSGNGASEVVEVVVPDIGDFEDVPVIEVLVAEGERVESEQALVTLESDKATMDVPAPRGGVVKAIRVAVGDSVSEGTVILDLEADAAGAQSGGAKGAGADTRERDEARAESPPPREADAAPARETLAPGAPCAPARGSPTAALSDAPARRGPYHATPAVRAFARELGVDLGRVTGTGRKGRILHDDIKRFVKETLTAPAAAAAGPGAGAGTGIPPIPVVDFAKFGEVETRPLSRIKALSGPHLHRAWLNIPHVTHHDEVDITELEAFRQSLKAEGEKRGVRVTALTFIMKAVVAGLREFPSVNSSLGADGKSLVLKKYFHIGIAVDTPNGLVVPVFRDVDRKGIWDLAAEMADVSKRARDGKLKPDEMQGGCFSISSLGGIGGTAFTPIVNAPEVAILGVTRARMSPVWDGKAFVPRLMLPVDLSYDHRVIDGAEAARFVATVCTALGDLRRLLL